MIKLAILFACCLAVCFAAELGQQSGEQLASFCAAEKSGNQKKLPPKSREATLKLIDQYEKWNSEVAENPCPKEFAKSFADMRLLLQDQAIEEDACSGASYAQLRQFHLKYIHPYNPELKREELIELKGLMAGKRNQQAGKFSLEPIPPALRNFFILFVKQINASCKQIIASKLRENVEKSKLVGDLEFQILQPAKNQNRRLLQSNLIDSLAAIRETETFDELEIVNLESTDGAYEKLYVQVPYGDSLKQIRDACLVKLKPIYDEVFAPAIRLNNLGYFDRSHTAAEDKELSSDQGLTRWFDIIQSCELFKDLEVLQDCGARTAFVDLVKTFSPLLSNAEGPKIKLLSREEAEEIQENIEKSKKVLKPLYNPDPIDVVPIKVPPPNRLWLEAPSKITKELESFDRDLERIIGSKTDKLKKLKDDVTKRLYKSFFQYKEQISSKDPKTTIGRFAAFIERHNASIKIAMVVFSVLLLTMHLVG